MNDSGPGLNQSGYWQEPEEGAPSIGDELTPGEMTLNIWRFLKYRRLQGEIGGPEDGQPAARG